MSMNANQDYSQFYAGTEQIKSYGSNLAAKKDTLVKYRFNTTDEHGNKVMDKMSKEETMKAVNEISSQYGDSVIVQFSGDGLAALAEGGKSMSGRAMTEEEAAKRAARDAAFQAENVIQHENAHRIVIPNYETNEQLYNSLAGAGDNVISSTMGIISNYLMPGDASGLSEQERQDMAAFGLEAAKYLAENYLDESHAADFMSAMETVAKYGLSDLFFCLSPAPVPDREPYRPLRRLRRVRRAEMLVEPARLAPLELPVNGRGRYPDRRRDFARPHVVVIEPLNFPPLAERQTNSRHFPVSSLCFSIKNSASELNSSFALNDIPRRHSPFQKSTSLYTKSMVY